MTIQYTATGFEPTAFGTQVSSHKPLDQCSSPVMFYFIFYFQADFVAAFNSMVSIFQSQLGILLKVSSDLDSLVTLDRLELKFTDINLKGSDSNPDLNIDEVLKEVEDETRKSVEASYNLSFAQIKTVVQKKLNYFGLVTL